MRLAGSPEPTEQLLKHDFGEAEVRSILGENIMRVASSDAFVLTY
jgi:microsomal dipeptidase-like Zn-dependent dipeptidase